MSNQSLTRTELLALHNTLGIKARALMADKNHDYSTESDVFRNFRMFGTLGVLVRLSDKLARLRSFEENNKFAVSDEKLIDTILDTINYAVIYYAMKQEQAPEPQPASSQADDNKWKTIAILNPTVRSGPYCTRCPENNPADYYVDSDVGDRVYWCSNCAAEQNVDTSDMYIMENCA